MIENVWGIMKDRLEKLEPKTIIQWKEEIQRIWDEITHEELTRFIKTMPERIAACITSHGERVKL